MRELLSLGPHQVYNVVVFVGAGTIKTPMPAEVLRGVSALTKFIKSKRVVLFAEHEVTGFIDSLLNHRLRPGLRTNLTHVRNVKAACDGGACPRCGAAMIDRANKQSGERFLGCRRYPRCKGTLPLPKAV